MKKISFLVALLLLTSLSFAQKKEKIKGSKIVTITIKELENFNTIEVEDNIEVYFVKGEKTSIEIEADDNLHDAINYGVTAKTLKINTTKEVSGAKKFAVRINYSDSLKTIIGKNESKLHALAELTLSQVTIKNFDKSQSFLNVKADKFTLQLSDKSEAEINVKADNSTIELTKDAELKALINSSNAKIDLYQKGNAEIEGDAQSAKIRLDNNAQLTARKFTVKDIDLTTESYTKAAVNATKTIAISASGKSEIELLGEPKVDLRIFTQSAILYKKEK
ncbi:GIN domain-containing protein [Flavobacterium sp.]|uniref:GIN domain-containing protein n=1 Tax=Flavobacterium sp. TaxID=239 RepID=UPI0035AF46FC